MLTKEAKQFLLENTPKIPGLSARELPPMPDMSRRLKPMPTTWQDVKRFGRDVIQGAEDAAYWFMRKDASPAGKMGWGAFLERANQQQLRYNLLLGKNPQQAVNNYYHQRRRNADHVNKMYDDVEKGIMRDWQQRLAFKPQSKFRDKSMEFFYNGLPYMFSTGGAGTKLVSITPKALKLPMWLGYQYGEGLGEGLLHEGRRRLSEKGAEFLAPRKNSPFY
jgi:hypothetical protein